MQRIHATTSRMREIRKSGSVGTSGGRPPEVTRPDQGSDSRLRPPRTLIDLCFYKPLCDSRSPAAGPPRAAFSRDALVANETP